MRPDLQLRQLAHHGKHAGTEGGGAFDLYRLIPLMVLLGWCVLDAAATRLPL